MLVLVRRVGIAIGSLVAAWLVVWLVGGLVLPLIGIRALDLGSSGAAAGLVTVLLGGLIYRDIVRRERRPLLG